MAAAASTEPPGTGFAIQVAALRERDEADVIVKRLTGKGYPAYVVGAHQGRAHLSIACASASSRIEARPTRSPRGCRRKNSSSPGSSDNHQHLSISGRPAVGCAAGAVISKVRTSRGRVHRARAVARRPQRMEWTRHGDPGCVDPARVHPRTDRRLHSLRGHGVLDRRHRFYVWRPAGIRGRDGRGAARALHGDLHCRDWRDRRRSSPGDSASADSAWRRWRGSRWSTCAASSSAASPGSRWATRW